MRYTLKPEYLSRLVGSAFMGINHAKLNSIKSLQSAIFYGNIFYGKLFIYRIQRFFAIQKIVCRDTIVWKLTLVSTMGILINVKSTFISKYPDSYKKSIYISSHSHRRLLWYWCWNIWQALPYIYLNVTIYQPWALRVLLNPFITYRNSNISWSYLFSLFCELPLIFVFINIDYENLQEATNTTTLGQVIMILKN